MTIEITSAIFKKPLTWIIILTSLALIGGGIFTFYKFRAPPQTQKLTEEVGKLIDLPIGEEPTVATITDITKLTKQDFFQKAENGDVVLIYSQAKKAYLYSPTLKKILDVQPINTASPSTSPAEAPAKAGTPIP